MQTDRNFPTTIRLPKATTYCEQVVLERLSLNNKYLGHRLHRCKLEALPVNFSAFFNDLALLKKKGHGLSELFCAISSFGLMCTSLLQGRALTHSENVDKNITEFTWTPFDDYGLVFFV